MKRKNAVSIRLHEQNDGDDTQNYDPILLGELTTLPPVSSDFYFDELLDWILGHRINLDQTFTVEHDSISIYDSPIPDRNKKNYRQEFGECISPDDFGIKGIGKAPFIKKSLVHHRFLKSILNCIEENPHELVYRYATKISLDKLLGATGYTGETECIDLLISELRSLALRC